LGVLPLFFEERPSRRRPHDVLDIPVVQDDLFDQDPAQLFPTRWLGRDDCRRQSQEPNL